MTGEAAARPVSPATPVPALRKFWLCADDYGISPAVNRGIRDLIGRGLLRRLDPGALAAEAASQLAAFRSAFGRPPDFVDGHQHVHLLPQVSDALLAEMAQAAPGAWIRQCGRAVPWRQRWADPKG